MSALRPTCPRCCSQHTFRNGRIHNKKLKYQCQDYQRQFVEKPTKKTIDQETFELIDRLLLEKIPLAGIARATQVSETWLQEYVNAKYAHIARKIKILAKVKRKLTTESFVDNKGNKQWKDLTMDRKTKEIVGVYVGDHSSEGAKGLSNSLPPVYRQCAICFTEFWVSYENVIPKKRHQAVGKASGETNHIERFNNTMRQRISRLVRSTLSFSKSLEKHIAAIWYFIHHYNISLQA